VKRAWSAEDFASDPVDRYWAGATQLVWCRSPTVCGTLHWGRPRERDIAELTRALELACHPALAGGFDVFTDTSAIEHVEWNAYLQLLAYVRERAAAWSTRVGRHAIIVRPGPTAALLAGMAPLVGLAHPMHFVADREQALGWLGWSDGRSDGRNDGHSDGRAVLQPRVRTDARAVLQPVVRADARAVLHGPARVDERAAIYTAARVDARAAVEEAVQHAAAMRGLSPIVQRLRGWLEHALVDATLESAAAGLATSARSLQRELHDAGTSFSAELHAARVRAACELLGETDDKIDVIAQAVGATTGSRLSRLFRRQLGITPARFRALHREVASEPENANGPAGEHPAGPRHVS